MNISRRETIILLSGLSVGSSVGYFAPLSLCEHKELPYVPEVSIIQLLGLGLLPLNQLSAGYSQWEGVWQRIDRGDKEFWLKKFTEELSRLQSDSDTLDGIVWSESAIANLLKSERFGQDFSDFVSTVYQKVFDTHEFVSHIYGPDYRATKYADPDFL